MTEISRLSDLPKLAAMILFLVSLLVFLCQLDEVVKCKLKQNVLTMYKKIPKVAIC